MTASDDNIRYKKLIENMNEAVWMGDSDERTVYANPKFCELMEMELEEMLGRESYDFWDEESAETVRNVNETDRKDGIVSEYEGNLKSKSGKLIPVLLNGTPLPDGGTIGIMTDLRKLKEREAVYRRLVESMNEAVWMGDKDERTIYANPKFREMTEYTLDEMLGEESYIFWDEESAKRVKNVNTTDRKKGIKSSYEGTIVSKSGKRTPVLLSGTPLPDGGTIGIMTDLSELKKNEKKAATLGRAIEHSNDAVILFDNKGKILSWNAGATKTFGYSEKEILGENIEKLLIDGGKVLEYKKHKFLQVDTQVWHKKGEPIFIETTLTKIGGKKDEKNSQYLLIARNIGQQRQMQKEILLKYDKMQQAYNEFGIIRRRMDYIFELLHEIQRENQTVKELADFIVSSLIMLTRADACLIRVMNNDRLEMLSSFGMTGDWSGKKMLSYKDTLSYQAFKEGGVVKIFDISTSPDFPTKGLAMKNNLSSVLALPLSFRGKFIGTVSLYIRSQKDFEIFENAFIPKYKEVIEVALGTLLESD